MSRDDGTPVHLELVSRICQGEGEATRELRCAAFDNIAHDDGVDRLVETTALDPPGVTGDHFATASGSGLSEDQVWEVAICAAVGQASRQYEAGLAALETAVSQRAGS